MKRIVLVGSLILGLAPPLASQANHHTWDPATAAWSPAGPKMESSQVFGDPSKSGAFTVAYRLKPGAWIPPHTHTRPKQVIVLVGFLRMGLGAVLDSAASRPLTAGQIMIVPPETAHFEGASVETVVLFSGDGPLITNWVKQP